MAAFQLGLYALGLHNCVSANWLSRTYSSHVSWITGKFNRIGILIPIYFNSIYFFHTLLKNAYLHAETAN